MPTWPVHLKIANRLKEKYNYTDDFILGNVIPDTMNGHIINNPSNIFHHAVTHYSTADFDDFLEINIDKFLEENKDKLDNEIILGTYIHLLADKYFNDCTKKNHFKTIGDTIYAILNDGTIDEKNHPMIIKQEDFRIFGECFIKNNEVGNKISLTKDTLKLCKDLHYPIEKEDIDKTVDKINEIVDTKITEDEEYKMFTEKELVDAYNSCYEMIDKTLYELELEKKISQVFNNYVGRYNMEDADINYKYYHSYRVMNYAKELAKKLNLSKEDQKLAIINALFHDIGRFEQDKLFDSYIDTKKFDHGDYGAEVLIKQELIKELPVEEKYYSLISKAVKNHNKYSIEEGLSDQELLHAQLVRDVDKLDILDYMSKGKLRKKAFDYTDETFTIRPEIKEEFFQQKIIYTKNKSNINNSEKAIITLAFVFDIKFKETAEYILNNSILDSFYNILPNKENYKEYFDLAKKHLKE